MCQFNISFSGDAESLTIRAKQEIEKAGGSFIGDAVKGEFRVQTPIGAIKGEYRVADQEIAISITKKPFLLPCSRIEKELTAVMQ